MAFEGQQITIPGLTAGEDLSTKQFHFVKQDGTTAVLCNAATDVPVGVLQNKPTSGQTAEICMIGLTKVSSNAALTAGLLIGTSTDGQADSKIAGTDLTEYVVGQVVLASGAADELTSAMINCASPHRAT